MYTMTPGMLFLSQDETLKIEYQLLHFLGIIFWEYKLQDNVSDNFQDRAVIFTNYNVLINRIKAATRYFLHKNDERIAGSKRK